MKKVRWLKGGMIALLIGALICMTMLPLVAREKTPIETYNPGFKFPEEKIAINYWQQFPERKDRIIVEMEIAEEYMRLHPNVTINNVVIPWVGHEVKYISSFEAGTGPDVFIWHPAVTVPKGYSVYPPDWVVKIFEEKYTKAAQLWMKIWNKWIGIPGSELDAGQMLYVNWDMFEEAGIFEYPKTLAELLTVAKKLTILDSKGEVKRAGWGLRHMGAGGVWHKFSAFWLCFVDPTKPKYFNEDFTDIVFDNPDTVEALEFYGNMVHKWKVASVKLPNPVDAFKLKLAAMTNREAFMAGIIEKDAPDIHYKMFPLVIGNPPYGHYSFGVIETPGHTLMVSKDSKYPQIAWDFIMFLTNDKNDLRTTEAAGGLPKRKANMDSDYVRSLPYTWVMEEMFGRPPEAGELDPYGVLRTIQEDAFATAVEAVLYGTKSSKEALQDAAERARKILKEAGEKKEF